MYGTAAKKTDGDQAAAAAAYQCNAEFSKNRIFCTVYERGENISKYLRKVYSLSMRLKYTCVKIFFYAVFLQKITLFS